VTAPSSPRLAIVVIVYNMQREARRTLRSLSAGYQQGVTVGDYEVIVVENGSTDPLESAEVAAFGENFRYLRIENANPSPAGAINRGVELTTAPNVAVMIDGARMATPGIIARALELLERSPNAIVATVALHLGPEVQFRAMLRGYDKAEEDRLLDSIDWPAAGHRLFEIGVFAPSSGSGWFAPLSESNLLFMPRQMFDRLGGMDERFSIPGGGLVNLDFYMRACEEPNSQLFCLLGEATFHQIHSGVMTNRPEESGRAELRKYNDEYLRIRNKPFRRCDRMHLLYGAPCRESLPLIRLAAETALA
jgi:glycosyltransferase involved in cell wall biosynthesis